MRITEQIVEHVVAEVEKDILCNKCEKSIYPHPHTVEGPSVVCRFGYGSRHDGDMILFDLCDNCFEEVVNSFKIPPVISDAIGQTFGGLR